MTNFIEDLHITRIRPLLSPAVLAEEIPATTEDLKMVASTRKQLESILDSQDSRLLVIAGPCSIHDPEAALDYATQIKAKTRGMEDRLILIMRVYFEKPRTVVGWKGLISDPDLDGSFDINKGLRSARRLLRDVSELGIPAGTEFLDTTFGQYYADLVSWAAIGARTSESQIHRELASGLSMPVGIKNRTDGDVQVAVDAIRAATYKHLFPSLTKEGVPAIFETKGNRYCHLVLRGGDRTGPNYDEKAVLDAVRLLARYEMPTNVIVDCSHGNSKKDPRNQKEVVRSVAASIKNGVSEIKGVMLESNLVGGRQEYASGELRYGQSITDGCLSLEETMPLFEQLYDVAAGI